jgi:ribonuclease HI
MATTAKNHPIHTWIIQARKDGGPPHMSNLGNLVKRYPQYIQPNMEHIIPFLRPPWWKSPATTEIPRISKDKAAEAHKLRLSRIPTDALTIYTDGSGHNGHIGAAIYSPTTNVIKGEYIGTDDTHNVYAAELTAIRMAITTFQEMMDKYSNIYIFTDNQAAIQAVDTPTRQSGQNIIEEILDTIEKIHEYTPNCNIHIEWVPGHKNIEGNERADLAAKTAAIPNNISPNIIMKSAQNRSIQSMSNAKWEAEWRTGKENARRLRSMSKYPGTTTGPKLYGALQQRKHVVCITRLRTGHCHLNEYLHRFNIIETAECECGAAKETIDHFLLNCELYDEERDKLRRKVGAHGMRTCTLLGDKNVIRYTMEYIEETGRFSLEHR